MAKNSKKVGLKGRGGGLPRPFELPVSPFVSYALIAQHLGKVNTLTYGATQVFLFVAYLHGGSCTPSMLCAMLGRDISGSAYRSIQYRLEGLMGKGLIERFAGNYRLSAKGIEAVTRVVIEGEGARVLAEIERKRKNAERMRIARAAATAARLAARGA